MARVFGMSCNIVGRYMNATHMARIAPLRNNAIRCFGVTASPCIQAGKHGEEHDIGSYHNTSKMDKKLLVKAKMFPDIESTPDRVPLQKMNKAKDHFRVRVSIWMIAGCVITCLGVTFWGKHLARQGHSVARWEIAKANELRAQHFAEQEAKK